MFKPREITLGEGYVPLSTPVSSTGPPPLEISGSYPV